MAGFGNEKLFPSKKEPMEHFSLKSLGYKVRTPPTVGRTDERQVHVSSRQIPFGERSSQSDVVQNSRHIRITIDGFELFFFQLKIEMCTKIRVTGSSVLPQFVELL
jgi:hypothetical protein